METPLDTSGKPLGYNPWYYYLKEQGITRLVKKRKPCLPDNYVHILCNKGMYRVHSVHLMYFTIMKNREERKISWDQFVCLAGQGQSPEAKLKRVINHCLANNMENAVLLSAGLQQLKRGH